MCKARHAAGLVLALLLACQATPPNSRREQGALKITVQFPQPANADRQPGFAVKLIKPETRVIYVIVYQQGAPVVFGPITPSNAQVRLNQLAAGEQTLLAAAYDQQRQLLTAGQQRVFVKANSVTQASLELSSEFAALLSAAALSLLQGLKVEVPPPGAKLPEVLEPQQPVLTAVGPSAPPVLPPARVHEPESIPSEAPEPSLEPQTEHSPTPRPGPQPTATPRHRGGGGSSGPTVTPEPTAEPTPTPEPTPEPSVGSGVTVQDGSDALDPVTVSREGAGS